MAATELTSEQAEGVRFFGDAMMAIFVAIGRLEELGVDISTALRSLPGSEEGRSMFDELPASLRMML